MAALITVKPRVAAVAPLFTLTTTRLARHLHSTRRFAHSSLEHVSRSFIQEERKKFSRFPLNVAFRRFQPEPVKCYSSSFIRQVLDEVEREIQRNPELRASVEDLTKSATGSLSWILNLIREVDSFSRSLAQGIKSMRSIRQVEAFSSIVGSIVRNVILKRTVKILLKIGALFQDELEQSVKEQSIAVKEVKLPEIKEYQEVSPTTDSLILTAQESVWERFSIRLKDMPFLKNFLENPLVGSLFTESAQAVAIKKAKQLDETFSLPRFVALTEHVILPHFLAAFLQGDAETLKKYCSRSAFGAVEASLAERQSHTFAFDSTILLIRNVEFKGAALMGGEKQQPCFVFTFNAQQINCVKEKKSGKVLSGAVDDIRELVYSIAITPHPEQTDDRFLYPYQIMEFAILSSTPSW